MDDWGSTEYYIYTVVQISSVIALLFLCELGVYLIYAPESPHTFEQFVWANRAVCKIFNEEHSFQWCTDVNIYPPTYNVFLG